MEGRGPRSMSWSVPLPEAAQLEDGELNVSLSSRNPQQEPSTIGFLRINCDVHAVKCYNHLLV